MREIPDPSTSDPSTPGAVPGCASYEIRLRGRLGPHWASRFDGMTLTALEDGTTVLRGPVADQAALHGLLRRLGDLGIPLLSVTQQPLDEEQDLDLRTPSTPGD